MVRSCSHNHGRHKRTLRQIYNEVAQPYVRSELVQLLPDDHNDSNLRPSLVSQTSPDHSIPVEMEHPADFHIHLHRRLCLFHIIERSRLPYFCRISCAPQFGNHLFRLRSHFLQGTQPQGQAARPGSPPGRYGIHLDRHPVIDI